MNEATPGWLLINQDFPDSVTAVLEELKNKVESHLFHWVTCTDWSCLGLRESSLSALMNSNYCTPITTCEYSGIDCRIHFLCLHTHKLSALTDLQFKPQWDQHSSITILVPSAHIYSNSFLHNAKLIPQSGLTDQLSNDLSIVICIMLLQQPLNVVYLNSLFCCIISQSFLSVPPLLIVCAAVCTPLTFLHSGDQLCLIFGVILLFLLYLVP